MHSPDIHITGIDEKDLDALRAISIQSFTETFSEHNTEDDMRTYVSENLSPERLLHELQTVGSHFYMLRLGDEPAGYLKLNEVPAQTMPGKPGTLEIERIYILRAFHGKQLGTLLLRHAMDKAREKDYAKIWLGVWEHNTKAIAFYERNGFVKTGSHDFVLGNDVQTDYVMERSLTN